MLKGWVRVNHSGSIATSPTTGNGRDLTVARGIVATPVAAHPGFVEIQIVGIRPTADRQQQMRASHFRGAVGAIDLGDDLAAAFREADAFSIQLTSTPSRSTMSLIAADTSSSSWRTSRGAISMIVTWLPKRRYIWPNSRPT